MRPFELAGRSLEKRARSGRTPSPSSSFSSLRQCGRISPKGREFGAAEAATRSPVMQRGSIPKRVRPVKESAYR